MSFLCVKFIAAIFTTWCATTPAPAAAVKPATPPPVVAVAPPVQPLAPPSKTAAANTKKSAKKPVVTEVGDRPKAHAEHHVARRRHHHVQHYSTPAEYSETRALNAKQLQH
jgi:hypothetical protein